MPVAYFLTQEALRAEPERYQRERGGRLEGGSVAKEKRASNNAHLFVVHF